MISIEILCKFYIILYEFFMNSTLILFSLYFIFNRRINIKKLELLIMNKIYRKSNKFYMNSILNFT